ncbi:tyrosinase cofactor [Streptomyces sp. NPDC000594]|uniref:apotyrosinase chaperone MelC1 n=1 Tax=Streptomyces sp. NPDC000594 TaxID=3154261 RepID=UPI0033200327
MSGFTRRQMVGAAAAAAAGTVVAGVATAAADSSPAKPAPSTAPGGPAAFDEVFKGRHIQGEPVAGGHAHGHAHGGRAGRAHHQNAYRVLIDGRELHVMHHGKAGWSSTVNHYERFATPLDAARTAVLTIKGAAIVPFDPTA